MAKPTEFQGFSAEEWKARIVQELKGKPYEETLVKTTPEGIPILPFYTKESKGNNAPARTYSGWLNRQDDLGQQLALDFRNEGLDAFGWRTNGGKLENWWFELDAPVTLWFENLELVPIDSITKQLDRFRKNSLTLSYPLTGKVDFEKLGHLFQLCDEFPNFYPLTVSGIEDGTYVDQLSSVLISAVSVFNRLTEEYSIDLLAPKTVLATQVSNGYFEEIAKLRALRILWANLVQAYQPKDTGSIYTFIHVETIPSIPDEKEPYLNLISNTTQAMSALIGGADSLTVAPYNGQADDGFAVRIAKNVSLLLQHEGFMDKVADPGHGSYYLENLTQNFIEKAWGALKNV